MKKILLSLAIALLCSALNAQQPKWLKNARKGTVTLYVISQRGDTLVSPSFFLDEKGTVVAPFKTIQNAQNAWVTDAKGQDFPISRVLGFNSTYNVTRLQANMGKKKSAYMPMAKGTISKSACVYLLPNAAIDTVTQVESAGDYSYYTLKQPLNTDWAGMPAMNNAGEIVGIVQAPVVVKNAPNYLLDIAMVPSLEIHAMDANHPDLQNCNILKQLPKDEKQAQSFLYICRTTPENMVQYANDFIAAFPESTTGYIQKAEALANSGKYEEAQAAYDEGLKNKGTAKDEIYYSKANLIYQQHINLVKLPETWSMDEALLCIKKANDANPSPLYTLLEARILYAQKNYQEAGDKFVSLTQTNMRSAEMFLYAAQCYESAGGKPEDILALEDSAMTFYSRPYTMEAAKVLWMRANTRTDASRFRDAIADLNDYEHLMNGRLTDNFYYQREQLEQRVRMYAQAISDIDQAIKINAEEPLYYAEKASLMIRIGDNDQALEASNKAIELNPSMSDAYRLKGISLREKGDKEGAKAVLQKAIELGDQIAQGILDKMQ